MERRHWCLHSCREKELEWKRILHFVPRACPVGWRSKLPEALSSPFCNIVENRIFSTLSSFGTMSWCLASISASSFFIKRHDWRHVVLCRGVSSFNTFVAEYDSDSDSNSEYGYESGIEDSDGTAPPSPSTSECSHLSRSGSSGRHRRRNKTLLLRLLLLILWPLRLLVHLFWYVRFCALKFVASFFWSL